jgi:L-iditol 2-dehydrogenase
MKTAYFTDLSQIELREEPKPEIGDPGEVLVQIERVGVCGSDVHYYTEGRIGKDRLQYPATLGHEAAGRVVALGTAVESVAVGDKVVIEPAISCGNCDQCRGGRENTCRKLQFMGCPGQAPGTAAEFRVLHQAGAIRVPDSLGLDQAVLAEPLSIGLHAVHLAGPNLSQGGADIGILGSGPIGLSVLACARATIDDSSEGATSYFMTEPIAERRAMARQFGVEQIVDPFAVDPVAKILDACPLGLDTVFECSGDPRSIDQAIELLKPGGRLVLVGIPEPVRVEFDIHMMRRKELTFVNVRRQNNCVEPVIQMMADARINVDQMITHRFAFEQIVDAFELVANYDDGVVKAILEL